MFSETTYLFVLSAKFEIYSMILTSFRPEGNFTPPPSVSKRTPKKPTHIRVNEERNVTEFFQ